MTFYYRSLINNLSSFNDAAGRLTYLAGHMRPARRVFETPGLQVLNSQTSDILFEQMTTPAKCHLLFE